LNKNVSPQFFRNQLPLLETTFVHISILVFERGEHDRDEKEEVDERKYESCAR
jgi:hypothetical protein